MRRFVPPEPADQYGVLARFMLLSTGFAWYCLQLRSNDALGIFFAGIAGILVLSAWFTLTLRNGLAAQYVLGWAGAFLILSCCCFGRRNSSDARSQPIYFPLLPRYWFPALNRWRARQYYASPRHQATLRRLLKQAQADSTIDSDVFDETNTVCTTDATEWVMQGGVESGEINGSPVTQLVIIGMRKFFMKDPKKAGANSWFSRCMRCCRHKKKTYAVDGVCLSMQTNATFALLGHNGAGKTTLINMVTAQLRPSEGDALVCGSSVNFDAGAVRKNYGCCPQHDVLYPELSAQQHLSLFGMLKGRRPSELATLIPDMLKQLALSKGARHASCGTERL